MRAYFEEYLSLYYSDTGANGKAKVSRKQAVLHLVKVQSSIAGMGNACWNPW
jgi:hypothetical protein